MFYDRKIKYLDYYEGGVRVRGGGFVKLEARDTSLRVEVAVSGLYPNDSFTRDVVIRSRKKESILGKIVIKNGRGQFRQSCQDLKDLEGSGIGYDELQGVSVTLGAGRELSCSWPPRVLAAEGENRREGMDEAEWGSRKNGMDGDEGENRRNGVNEEGKRNRREGMDEPGQRNRREGMDEPGQRNRRKGMEEPGQGNRREGMDEAEWGSRKNRMDGEEGENGRNGMDEAEQGNRREGMDEAEWGSRKNRMDGEEGENGRNGMDEAEQGNRREGMSEDKWGNGRNGMDEAEWESSRRESDEAVWRNYVSEAVNIDEGNQKRSYERNFDRNGNGAGKEESIQSGIEKAGETVQSGLSRVEGKTHQGGGNGDGEIRQNEMVRQEGTARPNGMGRVEGKNYQSQRNGAQQGVRQNGKSTVDRNENRRRTGNMGASGTDIRESPRGGQYGVRNQKENESQRNHYRKAEQESSGNERGGRGGQRAEAGKAVKLLEDKWTQLCAIYPHIRPFRDKREYLSIGPADFVLFPAASYKLVNNSFLLHGYYNYHHLILTRLEQKGEYLYYIGVPGSYFEKEKQVAIMFGFESFECETEPAQAGDFGYYMMRTEL